jgi:hypothetical protein
LQYLWTMLTLIYLAEGNYLQKRFPSVQSVIAFVAHAEVRLKIIGIIDTERVRSVYRCRDIDYHVSIMGVKVRNSLENLV